MTEIFLMFSVFMFAVILSEIIEDYKAIFYH